MCFGGWLPAFLIAGTVDLIAINLIHLPAPRLATVSIPDRLVESGASANLILDWLELYERSTDGLENT